MKASFSSWGAVVALTFGSLLPALLAPPAHAVERTVTNTADSGPGSLRQVALNAAPGDTILFAVRGEIRLTSGEIVLDKNLTISGPGAIDLSIANFNHRVFRIQSGVTVSISGLTLVGRVQGTSGADAAAAASGENGGDGGDGGTVGGGAIANHGTLTLTGCLLNGTARGGDGGDGGPAGEGGAQHGHGGDGGLALGGAIYNDARLTMQRCTLDGNVAAGGAGGWGGSGIGEDVSGGNGGNGGVSRGGALFSAGLAIVTNCTFQRSLSLGGSGGDFGFGGTNDLTRYGVVGAPGAALGGAIANAGQMRLVSSTLTANRAFGGTALTIVSDSEGGGLSAEGHDATFTRVLSTIIAGNSTRSRSFMEDEELTDTFGPILSLGHNLIGILDPGLPLEDRDGFLLDDTDRHGTVAAPLDPKLGQLTYNGGKTQTLEPLPDSPALDAGFCDALTIDQRGVTRPINLPNVPNAPGSDGCDIGAVEVKAPAPGTFVVNTLDDHDDGTCSTEDCSLRDALRAALLRAGEDNITFKASLSGTLSLMLGEVWVQSPVRLTGPGRDKVKIDAHGDSRIFFVRQCRATIGGLNMVQGFAQHGGALEAAGATLTLRDCAFTNNRAQQTGGALFCNSATIRVLNTTLRSNQARDGGAIGMPIGFRGEVTLESCVLRDNRANVGGGAVYMQTVEPAPFTAINCGFVNNTATEGGALDIYGRDVALRDSLFQGNTALVGGAIVLISGDGSITNCRFDSNRTTTPGGSGGALVYGLGREPLVVRGSTFVNNQAGRGGAIHNNGVMQMASCTFSSNKANRGGGLFNSGGGRAGLVSCTLSDNTMQTEGGGAYNDSLASLSLRNCTIAANVDDGQNTDSIGGGVSNAGLLVLNHCTITRNAAAQIAGGVNSSHREARATVTNTIIAGNQARDAPDVTGDFISQGFNLIGVADGGRGFTQSTDQTGTASSPLAPNLLAVTEEGVTYYRPLGGSPALDKGTVADLPRDALRQPRPVDLANVPNATGGDGSDIGAIEVQSVP